MRPSTLGVPLLERELWGIELAKRIDDQLRVVNAGLIVNSLAHILVEELAPRSNQFAWRSRDR